MTRRWCIEVLLWADIDLPDGDQPWTADEIRRAIHGGLPREVHVLPEGAVPVWPAEWDVRVSREEVEE